jgi:4-methyl-5(b-hydroxyethyl)-thiazole monophosphate biosynthesis
MATAAVLFADGFEEIEAVTVVDVLRRAEFEVHMVGVEDQQVTGSHAITLAMDLVLAELDLDALDALILPGGMPGSANLAASAEVQQALRKVHSSGRTVAAICAAPIALQAAGVSDGRRVTSYPTFAERVPDAHWQDARVVVDERVVTSQGPATAIEFALTLVEQLGGAETARALRAAMLAD